jgi:hypothetical protein
MSAFSLLTYFFFLKMRIVGRWCHVTIRRGELCKGSAWHQVSTQWHRYYYITYPW